MEEMETAKRSCPECGSEKYLFRGRKKFPVENGQAEATETKYRCKQCEHIWRERVPMNASKEQ